MQKPETLEPEVDERDANEYGYQALRHILDDVDRRREQFEVYADNGTKQQYHEVLDYVTSLIDNLFVEGIEAWSLDIESLQEEGLI